MQKFLLPALFLCILACGCAKDAVSGAGADKMTRQADVRSGASMSLFENRSVSTKVDQLSYDQLSASRLCLKRALLELYYMDFAKMAKISKYSDMEYYGKYPDVLPITDEKIDLKYVTYGIVLITGTMDVGKLPDKYRRTDLDFDGKLTKTACVSLSSDNASSCSMLFRHGEIECYQTLLSKYAAKLDYGTKTGRSAALELLSSVTLSNVELYTDGSGTITGLCCDRKIVPALLSGRTKSLLGITSPQIFNYTRNFKVER